MITQDLTNLSVAPRQQEKPASRLLFQALWVVCFAGLFAGLAQAKDVPVNAIALFDSADGSAAYSQITGLTLNGKTEVRVCDGVQKLEKHAYDSLPRIQLAGAVTLERGANGVLMLTGSAAPMCVVPNGVKFDRNAELTLSEAADQTILQGTVVDPVPGEMPLFKPGVKLVFVAAPDGDLAQYLRAQRANSVKGWQDFLAHNAASSHVADAKKALAAIFEAAADAAFADYQKSVAVHATDLSKLKQAQQQAEQASKALEGYTPAHLLMDKINKELDALLDTDRTKLQAYRKALTDHTGGYQQLVAARQHVDQVLDVNPKYLPTAGLQADIAGEQRKLDSTLDNAEAQISGHHYDEAVTTLGVYRAFAGELPRVDAIVKAAYTAHITHAQELGAQQNWEQAVAEYQKALAIKPDSADAAAGVKSAQEQLSTVKNKQAAEQALQQSKAYVATNQMVEAYEVLASLPDAQRAYVSGEMDVLKKDYAAAAFKRAQKQQEGHIPIRTHADEDAVREAIGLLQRASAITGDPAMKLRLDLLSDKIGAYYFDLAKRYLERPAGSGVGLGWLYLMQAQRYNQALDGAKDEMARYTAAFQLRGHLSVGVVFRDQTSRRDSNGFADQMGDAVANGLESSGLPIKVVRHPSEAPGALQPNFSLVGEILHHRVVKNANLETLPSKYRAGTHDVKNEAWVTANQQYQDAQTALATAQRALTDAQAHRKKDIPAATDAVTAAQQKADDARKKLDATEQTRPEPVIQPYNYTKKTIDLSAVVELAIRVTDTTGNVVEPAVPVKQENHKVFIVLESVKPEDTEGIKAQNTDPDENQFLTDLEVLERDSLIKTVHDQATQLPDKILQEARKRAQTADFDSAAEEYILYLNSTSDNASPERAEANKFLRDHFNVTAAAANVP